MTNEIMSDVLAFLDKDKKKIPLMRNNLTSIFVLAFQVTWHSNNKRPTLSTKTTTKKQLYELYDETRKRSQNLRNFKQKSRGRM